MARTVLDTARLLQATAGYDGMDDRQLGAPRPDDLPRYLDLVLESRQTGVRGLKIGILREAFLSQHLAPSVERLVRQAIQRFVDLGAVVKEVSVPT
jgi:amidase